MIIYNLFPLLAGKFTDWEKHLLRASEMGFNWVFVNPVQRPGMSGSLYSIADYFDFNPLLIDPNSQEPPQQQLKTAVDLAEKLGLNLMVDLVLNHCSVDSDLTRSHPDWFVWEGRKRVAHPFCYENGKKVVWGDLAKFDHRNKGQRRPLWFFFQHHRVPGKIRL
jgi:starch synthase (maltosyl-transferring)